MDLYQYDESGCTGYPSPDSRLPKRGYVDFRESVFRDETSDHTLYRSPENPGVELGGLEPVPDTKTRVKSGSALSKGDADGTWFTTCPPTIR